MSSAFFESIPFEDSVSPLHPRSVHQEAATCACSLMIMRCHVTQFLLAVE